MMTTVRRPQIARTSDAKARMLLLKDLGYRQEFAGTRAQLIAANLAQSGDFPGDPECSSKVRHSLERGDRSISIRVRSFVADPITYVLWLAKGTRVTRMEERKNELKTQREANRREAPPLANRTDCGKRKPPRDYAREYSAEGIGLLAHAFNYCDNPQLPYRYSRAVLDRFRRLATEIVELLEDGEIVELPHVLARNDAWFQGHIAAMLAQSKKLQRKRPSSP